MRAQRRSGQHDQQHRRPEQHLEDTRDPVQGARIHAFHARNCQRRAVGTCRSNNVASTVQDDAVGDELPCNEIADVVGAETAALSRGDLASDLFERVFSVRELGDAIQRPRQLNVADALTLDQPWRIDERTFLHLTGQSHARCEARSFGYLSLELVRRGRKLRHHP